MPEITIKPYDSVGGPAQIITRGRTTCNCDGSSTWFWNGGVPGLAPAFFVPANKTIHLVVTAPGYKTTDFVILVGVKEDRNVFVKMRPGGP